MHECYKNPFLIALSHADSLTDEEYRTVHTIATATRRARAGRFLHREDACRSLLGEALLYYVVKKRLDVSLSEVTIGLNEFGRPEIAGAPFVYSVSHSGTWVCCAVDSAPIGADVERVHKVDLKIADRFFCPDEAAYIENAASDVGKRERFFAHWVLKESYIKAIGRGLHCPLDSFECRYDASGEEWILMRHNNELPPLFFKLIDLPDEGYRCAVCTERKYGEIPLHILTAAAFIEMLSSL